MVPRDDHSLIPRLVNGRRGFTDGIKLRMWGQQITGFILVAHGHQCPVTGRGSELEHIRLLWPLLALNRPRAKACGWLGRLVVSRALALLLHLFLH